MTDFPPADDPAPTPSQPDDPALDPITDDLPSTAPQPGEPPSDPIIDDLPPTTPQTDEPIAQPISQETPQDLPPTTPQTDEPITELAAHDLPPTTTPQTDEPIAQPISQETPQDVPPPPPGFNPPPPPYQQPSPAPVRRLYRSRDDRKIGGVSAGIAEYFAIDPTLVRLVTLAAMISGIGLLVYIAAWIIVPLRPEGMPHYRSSAPATNERTVTIAFGLAALALAFGIVTDSWQVFAVALIFGGVWLLSEHAPGRGLAAAAVPGAGAFPSAQPGYPQPAYAGPDPTSSYQAPAYESSPYDSGSYPPPAPAQSVPVPPKERKPQRITWTVLSILALLAAVGIAASTGDWWDVSATRFMGIAVVTIGVGVVLGQIRGGGARGLIPLGILTALALFPVSALDGLVDDGIGDSEYRPLALIDVQENYSHGIGKLTVDLTEIDFTDAQETIDIELGIGELIVIIPDDVGGQAELSADAGEISHEFPRSRSFMYEDGLNIDTGKIRLNGENGSLDLTIDVGFGTAQLRTERGQ